MGEDSCSTAVYDNFSEKSSDQKQETFSSKEKLKESKMNLPSEDVFASRFSVLVVCLVTLCVLLVAAICTIIWLNLQTRTKDVNLHYQTGLIRTLTDQLTNLNQTLEAIMMNNRFPKGEFCLIQHCKLCEKIWGVDQDKCWLAAPEGKQNKKFCRDRNAVLVDFNH